MKTKYSVTIYSNHDEYASQVGGANLLIDDYSEMGSLISILLGTEAVILIETLHEMTEGK